ncbi:MAG TPA: MBOAT family O-acyltransferase [Leptospiraceae bacterium]|nr:MBOAT family O-acyltransferase [Leptospiraceae bacterium]
MKFNTLEFLIFFPISLIIGNLLKGTAQRIFLLLASYYFYMAWNKTFIVLILISTLLDYAVSLWLEKIPDSEKTKRKLVLTVSMVGNLGFLAFFKYTNFLLEVFQDTGLFSMQSWGAYVSPVGISCGWNSGAAKYICDITLPVGISFYTFQSMSYTIDVYFRKIEARKSFIDFSLYVAFFPQLVAGPIVRATTFLRDLDMRLSVTHEDIQLAFSRILIGFMRKVVFADNLAKVVDMTFANYGSMSPIEIWTGVIAFGWQIYFDFAGYTDIAIGVARLFGFQFDPNFNFPMSTNSIMDHWTKWHISFSTWIRDYIFIPLGGSRSGELRTYRNLFITWFFAGVWHGAAYHFISWGVWQGIMITAQRLFNRTKFSEMLNKKGGMIYDIFCRILTMFCLSFGFAMFRAKTMTDVWAMHKAMLFIDRPFTVDMTYRNMEYGILLFICFTASYIFSKRNLEYMQEKGGMKLVITNTVAILLILFFGITEAQGFLYFDF